MLFYNYIKGARCIISENSIILADSIIPPDTFIIANSVYGGKPGIFLF